MRTRVRNSRLIRPLDSADARKGQTRSCCFRRRSAGGIKTDGDVFRSNGGEFTIQLRGAIKNGRSVSSSYIYVPIGFELILFLFVSDLQGVYVTGSDVERVPDTAPFYAVCYALASMYLGLLYGVSEVELAKRAALLKRFGHGGNGTILQPMTIILLAVWTLTTDEPTEVELIDNAKSHLGKFTNSETNASSFLPATLRI
jgi:hypothetical protein